jgi:hypothetical protein
VVLCEKSWCGDADYDDDPDDCDTDDFFDKYLP